MTKSDRDLQQLRIDRTPTSGSGTSLGVRILILILVIAVGFLAWRQMGGDSHSLPEVAVERVLRVGGASEQSGVAANGYIVARTQAALSTDIQGRLVEMPVEEGDRVAKGDLIARIDTAQLEASRARASADLRAAQASERLAELELRRFKKLREDRHASEAELDSKQAQLEQAQATTAARRADLAEIDVRIAKSSVHAPFDGVVVEKNAEVGEVVSSLGSGGNARGSVATLVDFNSLEVQVELAQTSLRSARKNAPVLIYLDAFPDDAYRGRVRQIWPTANRQKATVELRIEILDRNERILPELGVRVVFVASSDQEVRPTEILLPPAALRNGPQPCVFVYKEGSVALRPVTIDGKGDRGYLRVASGLTGRELVVLHPAPDLVDGAEVRRQKEER